MILIAAASSALKSSYTPKITKREKLTASMAINPSRKLKNARSNNFFIRYTYQYTCPRACLCVYARRQVCAGGRMILMIPIDTNKSTPYEHLISTNEAKPPPTFALFKRITNGGGGAVLV